MQLRRIAFACLGACCISSGKGIPLGCYASQSTRNTAKVVVTDPDKGHSIGLRQGQVLEVRLESQPSTGYKWSLQADSTEKLKLLNEIESKPEAAGYDRPV